MITRIFFKREEYKVTAHLSHSWLEFLLYFFTFLKQFFAIYFERIKIICHTRLIHLELETWHIRPWKAKVKMAYWSNYFKMLRRSGTIHLWLKYGFFSNPFKIIAFEKNYLRPTISLFFSVYGGWHAWRLVLGVCLSAWWSTCLHLPRWRRQDWTLSPWSQWQEYPLWEQATRVA